MIFWINVKIVINLKEILKEKEASKIKDLTLSVLSFLVQVGIEGGSKGPPLHKTTKNNPFGIKIGTITEGP